MIRRYNAMERHFWMASALALVASVGTWMTAVRFQDARSARQDAFTSEAILEQCRKLPDSLTHMVAQSKRFLQTGTTVDLLTYRSAQQTWTEQTTQLWDGVRRDEQALRHFGDTLLLVERWQDRTVEAHLSGRPISPLAPALLLDAERQLQDLIAIEKTLYADRLSHRTRPANDFFAYGLGTLITLLGFGLLLRRVLRQEHYLPLDQLSLSAADLVEGEGLVPPPTGGGQELQGLSHNVHQLGIRFLSTRHELHQHQNQAASFAELAHLSQTQPAEAFYSAFAEQVARQLEARAAVVVWREGETLRVVGSYGPETSAMAPYLPEIYAALVARDGVLTWSESAAFPADLQAPLADLRCHALIAVPVSQAAAMVGMVMVWHGAGRHWPDTQQTFLRGAAGLLQPVNASGACRLVPQASPIGESIAVARDGKQRQWALDQALEEAVRPYAGAVAQLLLLQPDGRTLAVVAARGIPPVEWDGSRCALGEGLAGQAEEADHWQALDDTASHMHLIGNPFVRQWGPHAVACVPLPRLGRVRGVLMVYSRRNGAFASAEPHLSGVASQVSLGLQAAVAETVVLEAGMDWELVLQLGRRMQLAHHLRDACQAWIEVCRQAFPVDAASVYLRERDGSLRAIGQFGEGQAMSLDPTTCAAWSGETACAGGDGGCAACRDHGADPGHLCLPLRIKGQLVGLAQLAGTPSAYWNAGRVQLAEVMVSALEQGLLAAHDGMPWR